MNILTQFFRCRTICAAAVGTACVAVLLSLVSATVARADDFTWGGGTANWNATNWVTTTGTTTFPTGSSGTNTAFINSGTVLFAVNDTFGNASISSSPVIRVSTGATLSSNNNFNTLWNTNLNGGTLLANGGANASFGTFQLAGTLSVTGSNASNIALGSGSNNQINLGGSGNQTLTIDVADVTSSTAVDLTVATVLQNSSAASNLTKTGAGTLSLAGANTFSGATRIQAGSLSIGNASALQNSTLDLATGDTGTISVIGQNSTLGGLSGSRNLDMLTRTLSIGNNNSSTIYSGTLSNGALTKVGSGTLTLTAANTYTGVTTIVAGVLALAGGNNRLSTSSALTLFSGTLDLGGNSQTVSGLTTNGVVGLTSGTLTMTNGFIVNQLQGTINLGTNAAFVANSSSQRLWLNSGLTLSGNRGSSMTFGGDQTSGANFVGVDGSTGVLTLNGPTLNFVIGAGQANATWGQLGIATNSGVGLVTVQSGTMNVGSNLDIGARWDRGGGIATGSGTLTIAGGVVNVGTGTSAAGVLTLKNNNASSSGNATVNLDGGVLSVKQVAAGTGGGTKQFNFNGGTLQAAASTATFMNAATGFTANVGNGGATIDSGTFAITIGAALAGNGSGGLTKIGLGVLSLTGSNTFTGPATVTAGTLDFNTINALRNASGVSIAGAAGLRYSGSAASFDRNISVTSGTGTFANTGGGLLTLAGTLTKNGTVLRLTGGQFNVTGQIVGASVNSDLLVDGTSTVTLSSANTYNGPTFVNQASTLVLGTNNAIPSNSIVTLGNATSAGTLNMNGFTTTIGGLAFGAGGGTLRLAATSTSAASLTASAGTVTLTNGTLDLTGSGTSAGLYRLISAQTVSGSLASVTGASAAYQVVTSATSVDYQQRGVLGSVSVTNPSFSIITGGSAAFTYTVANNALSGGADLGFSSGSLSANLGGVSSGTALAGGPSGAISGLIFTGTSIGSNQQGTFTVTAPTAFGVNTATGTVSVNVLNHSLASFTSTDTASLALDFGTYNSGSWTGGDGGDGALGFSLWNIASGGFLAAETAGLALYDVVFTSGTNIFSTGLSNFANLTAGTSNSYAASVLSPGSLDQGTYQGVYTLKFRDQQNLSGAANTRDLTLTMNMVVVPEPGAIVLAGLGIGLAGWMAFRRRQLARPSGLVR